MNLKHFSIRVYAIVLNAAADAVLISDEFQIGKRMTKFPGGGMQFGEGSIDCLKREALEEFGQQLEILRHFYTTDFFQKAYFYADHQLISIYYLAKFPEPISFQISDREFDFYPEENGRQSFRWMKINSITPDLFTFPIDKVVAEMIKNQMTNNKVG